jgi:hypothetical protein
LILTELTPLASAVKQLKNIVLTFSYEPEIYFMLFYTLTFKTKNGDSEGKIRLMNQHAFIHSQALFKTSYNKYVILT